ncbi:MAG: hypothetical protein AABX40_05605, partial [Candidatus Hydrothermarchaeota archaeon]
MGKAIFFDLEGPLSPQDNAYEVLGLVERGKELFAVLSRYDDLLTLEGREGYEPGDTLKLILPFLIYHRVTEEDIRRVSGRAEILVGAKETVARLKGMGWRVYIISTSYEQHAHGVGARLGVAAEDIACTPMPLDRYQRVVGEEERTAIKAAEETILGLREARDRELVEILDRIFFDGHGGGLMQVLGEVRVVGGRRKAEAMERFLGRDGLDLPATMAVGDSITDAQMLAKVGGGGGLAVAFNGNEFSIPSATVALATTDMRALLPQPEAIREGGL